MRGESACKPYERYLRAEELFSDDFIKILRKKRLEGRSENLKDAAYQRFMNWQRAENEIAVYTDRAYADIEIPKNYD